jgi:hypothetical protein
MVKYSAHPPSLVKPSSWRLSQSDGLSRPQGLHRPHGTAKSPTTGAPIQPASSLPPVSITMPLHSWPGTTGYVAPCLWQEIASTPALREPALRHVPHVVLTAENAEQVAQAILDTPKAHRRAKQYLAHRFADILTETTVRQLMADLDVVPIGHTNWSYERARTRS